MTSGILKMHNEIPKNDRKLLSIVIPVLNERGNVPLIYSRIADVMKKVPYRYEIIFVDDVSCDGTYEYIENLSKTDKAVKGIQLSRQFSHQNSIMIGFQYAKGDAIITMDADLSHPPEYFPEMLNAWRQGYQVVLMAREKNKDTAFLRRKASDTYYYILKHLSSTTITANSAEFRLLDRKVLLEIVQFGESSPFIRGIVGWLGFRRKVITFKEEKRRHGKTKYSMFKMLILAVDSSISFSSRPLYISIVLGSITTGISFLYMFYIFFMKLAFSSYNVAGWTTIIILILGFSGVQLLSIGVLGIYIAKVFANSKNRPIGVVNKTAGFDLQ
jgi:polyisoprenyl-phosphate glycosyltransferase